MPSASLCQGTGGALPCTVTPLTEGAVLGGFCRAKGFGEAPESISSPLPAGSCRRAIYFLQNHCQFSSELDREVN